MSEYSFVEKPFLDQLAALGWTVVDQRLGIPTDSNNSIADCRRWLTDKVSVKADEAEEVAAHA